jgi:sugar lactone lactonase YvrE
MTFHVPVCLWDVGATLGEGVMWESSGQHVWFVDIKRRRIYRCAADGTDRRSWAAPGQVGFIVPADDAGMVCGLDDGLYRFDAATGQFMLLQKVEADATGNRFNDGHVDQRGLLWFGSMHDGEVAASGALYRFDGARVACVDQGYIITNGPAVSPDGNVLYHTDTLKKRVYAFDRSAAGVLSNKRLFVEITDGGYPDGMAVDAAGHIWIATFGGWRIDRFDSNGIKVGEVGLPCANVTKLAFGGADGKTVYVTTARKGLSEGDLARQPLAGGLFSFRVDTPGQAQHVLRLGAQAAEI